MLQPVYHKTAFALRRQKLMHSLTNGEPELVVLLNSPVYPLCSDATYPYRPDSSFFYITGLLEEESAALIWRDGKKINYQLFLRPRDPLMEQWNGPRLGPEGAKKYLQCDQAFPITELAAQVQQWCKNLPRGSTPKFYSNYSTHDKNLQILTNIIKSMPGHLRRGIPEVSSLVDVDPLIRQLRALKDETELTDLRRASEINVEAHLKIMQKLKPGMMEFEAQAIVEKIFLERGCRGPGYSSIFGSGPNAAILHYVENSRKMSDGELLLVDAGCEYKMYQSDITRVIPVGKKFSPVQRSLVEIVSDANAEATKCCVVGKTIDDYHKAASLVIIEGLKSLKILKGATEKIWEEKSHVKYFPHGTGHWIGLDVHDPCSCFDHGKSIGFAPGMVITVEPGIYFMENDTSVPKEFRGLGIRLEDNVVIQAKGKPPENLTQKLPRTWQEIEKLRI